MLLLFTCIMVVTVALTTMFINDSLNERGIHDEELRDLTFVLMMASLVASVIIFLYARGVWN